MNDQKRIFTLRAVILMLIFIVVIPFLPLLITRRWGWWEAWLFAIISVLGFVISRVLAAQRNPDIIAERAKFLDHEDTVSWDRLLSPLVGLGGGLVPLIAGLDALYGWSPGFGLPVKIIALALFLGGYAFSSYALIENRYFSGVVRLQPERDHHVISSGPYSLIRHPSYATTLIIYPAICLLLDSFWAFIPAIFLIICLIIRTNLEDQFLQRKLDGYAEYAKRVRYRLLPGIW